MSVFQYTDSPAVPTNTAPNHPLPLATGRPVNAAASASTDAIPSAPTNATGSTGPIGANPAASEFQRTFSQAANDDFRRRWDASLAASSGTAASCVAGGAASSTAPTPIPPSATGPANTGQLAAHAAAIAVTAAAYATVASRTVGVCFNPYAEFGSLHNAAITSLESLVWGTPRAALNSQHPRQAATTTPRPSSIQAATATHVRPLFK